MAFPIRKEYTAPRIKYLWKLFAEMVNQIVVGTLTWFHIFSVIGWSGAALTFLVTIKPSLAEFSPQASSEFSLKVIPKVRTVSADIFSSYSCFWSVSGFYDG
jgi:hypothetical protein